MDDNNGGDLVVDDNGLTFLQRNLADYLTISRLAIGLLILTLSLVGKGAYVLVVALTFIGAATDILDGMVARRYFGDKREGRLGRHDLGIDTFFVLCVLAYCSFAGIVIPSMVGLGWIVLALVAIVVFRRSSKILILVEVPTVIILLVIALLYNIHVFILMVVPAMAAGLIINRRRVFYLIFDYWPELFLK